MDRIQELLTLMAALPAAWHGAGCLEMPNLEALARHAQRRRIKNSVETGAGKTTLLLSHLSDHHRVFALDMGDSLSQPRQSPLLRRESVEFIEGPTQRTLPPYEFTEPLQLVVLDGPHAFPFPHLEYYKLYPHLEAGGVLVIDDIHIPTIRHLFNVLREDPMFEVLEIVGKTAFLERTAKPTFDPCADNWWTQPYNLRLFPVDANGGGLGAGVVERNVEAYRERLLPLIDYWTSASTRVALFGIGPHTDFLFAIVPELERLKIVAFLDTHPECQGRPYRGVAVQPPSWTAGQADVVLCSSFAHELTQLALLDRVPVKAVLSHAPGGSASSRC